MNARQRRFAEEYAVDHNGAAAAIRAGYAPGRAKQTARDLLLRPDVAQLVGQLDEEARAELGISKEWWIAQAVAGWEVAYVGVPRLNGRSGEPILVDGDRIYDRNLMAGAKFLELIAKGTGLWVDRSAVEVTGAVVYTLSFDRDLDEDDVDV